MADFDLFHFYREALLVVLAVYGLLITLYHLRRLLAALTDAHNPHAWRMRSYLQIQVLRIRMRRFAWDVLQIAGLLAILITILAMHSH